MMKKIFFALSLLLIQPVTFASDAALTSKLKLSPVAILGGGYSDDMQTAVGMSCLKPGSIDFTGGTKSIVTLGKSYTFDEIQKELHTNVSADMSIGLFSADASANYARYIKNSNYSESFYYLEKIALPTKYISTDFGLDALNSFGMGAYKAGPAQFRISCGNKFYQQVELGVNFFTTFKLVFNSAFDKSSFNASVNGSFGDFGSAKASIQRIVQEKNIRGTLEISAYQEGGDPTQIGKIFAKCADHYCITACSLDNMNACQGTIDGIINYAQNYLPKQIEFDPATKRVLGNANPLHYEFMNYTQLGLRDTSSQLTNETIAARQYLGHLYKETLHNQDIIEHILNSQVSANILKTYKDKLLVMNDALHANATLLDSNDGAIGCYFNPDKCIRIKNNIDALLKQIDMKVFEIFKTGFIVRGPGGPYLIIPIGGDQYQWFGNGGSLFIAQSTMKFFDNKILRVNGIDIYSDHFTGDFSKAGEDTYVGNLHYDTGRSTLNQITMVDNPI